MRRVLALVCAAMAVGGCDRSREPAGPPEAAQARALERALRDSHGAELAQAIEAYRALRGDDPAALRRIADAHRRQDDWRAQLAILDTLVARGQATADDHLDAMELVVRQQVLDDARYAPALAWLRAEVARAPDCRVLRAYVDWTTGRAEAREALDRALDQPGCARDHERAGWYEARARLRPATAAVDACAGASHGAHGLAEACIASGEASWRVDVARALRDHRSAEALAHLRAAAQAREVTVYALRALAAHPLAQTGEACEALDRALTRERAEVKDADDELVVTTRYAAERQARGCPSRGL